MLIDVRSIYVWLTVVGVLVGMFLSAEAGVWASAQHVVPPIAKEAIKPELDAVRQEQREMKAQLEKADAALQHADEIRAADLRQEMVELRASLEHVDGTMKALLLQLAAQGKGRP